MLGGIAMTFEDYVREHLDRANLSHKGLELVRMGWNARGEYGDLPEGGEAVGWVRPSIDKWTFTANPDLAETWRHVGKEVTPVYTHPSASVPDEIKNGLAWLMCGFAKPGRPAGYSHEAARETIEEFFSTTPQPADYWIKCSERWPLLGQEVELMMDGILQPYKAVMREGEEGRIWDFSAEFPGFKPKALARRDQWRTPRPAPTPPEEGAEG